MGEPATACASEMTPILMGSAANARLAETKTPQATTATKFDIAPTCRDFRLMRSPLLYVRRSPSVPSDNLGATQAGWQARPNPELQLGNRERPITSSANSRYYRPMLLSS